MRSTQRHSGNDTQLLGASMTGTDETSGYDEAPVDEQRSRLSATGVKVPASSAPELKSLLGIAVGTLVVAALYFAKDVLLPITLAVILSFVLSPVVNFMQRLRLWRAPAVILTVLAALALLGLVGTVIASQAASLSVNAPDYARTIDEKVTGVQGFAVEKLASITKQFGGGPKLAAHSGSPAMSAAGPPVSGQHAVPVEIVQGSTSPFSIAQTVLAPILSPLETTILVFIVAIFVLMQKEDLRDRFIRLFGSNDLHRTTRAMDDAGQRLSKYFLSQLSVNTCFGIVIGIGLWAIGIPSSAMWGLMAGLLRFVPYIGSLLAALAPAALGAAIDPGWAMAIEVIALFFVVEPVTGYVVEPMLYGHSTGLSPISVIVAAIFWTWVWGPIGLIISTPLTLCLVVLGRHVKSLEFFDVLLGDRPALTPVETFYQRILADNPDEALAHAETLLTERSLATYYEDVVLQSVKLAVDDQARGTIDLPKAQEMTGSILSVIDDLKNHGDVGPDGGLEGEDAVNSGRVACVVGSGTFDLVVATMLAQLLERTGLEVTTTENAKVGRQSIGTLDLDGFAVIMIVYLEISGSPAELRYLIRRLRDRAPSAKIVVGLWVPAGNARNDSEPQHAIDGDRHVSTLQEAVEAVQSLSEASARAA